MRWDRRLWITPVLPRACSAVRFCIAALVTTARSVPHCSVQITSVHCLTKGHDGWRRQSAQVQSRCSKDETSTHPHTGGCRPDHGCWCHLLWPTAAAAMEEQHSSGGRRCQHIMQGPLSQLIHPARVQHDSTRHLRRSNPAAHLVHKPGGLFDGHLALHQRLIHVQPPDDAHEVIELLRADVGVPQDGLRHTIPRRARHRRHSCRQRVLNCARRCLCAGQWARCSSAAVQHEGRHVTTTSSKRCLSSSGKCSAQGHSAGTCLQRIEVDRWGVATGTAGGGSVILPSECRIAERAAVLQGADRVPAGG